MAKDYIPNFKASHSAAHAVMVARPKSRGSTDGRATIVGKKGSKTSAHSVVRDEDSSQQVPAASTAEIVVSPAGIESGPRDTDPLQGTLVRLRKSMWGQIDDVWHKRRLSSRTETIRVLLAEAMAK